MGGSESRSIPSLRSSTTTVSLSRCVVGVLVAAVGGGARASPPRVPPPPGAIAPRPSSIHEVAGRLARSRVTNESAWPTTRAPGHPGAGTRRREALRRKSSPKYSFPSSGSERRRRSTNPRCPASPLTPSRAVVAEGCQPWTTRTRVLGAGHRLARSRRCLACQEASSSYDGRFEPAGRRRAGSGMPSRLPGRRRSPASRRRFERRALGARRRRPGARCRLTRRGAVVRPPSALRTRGLRAGRRRAGSGAQGSHRAHALISKLRLQ